MAHVRIRQSDGTIRGWTTGPFRDPAPVGHLDLQHDNPPADHALQRWDGATGLRDATPQEIADFRAEAIDARAQEALDGLKALKALALVVADLHNLTPAQMRALIVAKYKGL